MRSDSPSYDYSDLDLDSFELQLMQQFHVPAEAYARSEDLKIEAFEVSEANCSFNLSNVHISTELVNQVCTQNQPSTPCYRFTISDFGSGVVEAVATKQLEPSVYRRKISQQSDDFFEKVEDADDVDLKKRKSLTADDMDEEQLKRSVGRSKKLMRHKALMLKVDRMFTFTYRENQTDRELAAKHLAATIRRYKRISKQDFDYIAVFELQKRGAQHIHLAANSYHDINLLRECWQLATKDDGNVNIRPPAKGGLWKKAAIVSYISKYMLKDAKWNKLAKKRFLASHGIAKPIKHTYYLDVGLQTTAILRDLVKSLTTGNLIHFYDVPSDYGEVIFCKSY